jgi:hypothetical protein
MYDLHFRSIGKFGVEFSKTAITSPKDAGLGAPDP